MSRRSGQIRPAVRRFVSRKVGLAGPVRRADLRSAILRSEDTVAESQAMIEASITRKIALVAANVLAPMQTKRLQIQENAVLFDRLEDAEAWLFSLANDVAA